jgi:hypothetical protein
VKRPKGVFWQKEGNEIEVLKMLGLSIICTMAEKKME